MGEQGDVVQVEQGLLDGGFAFVDVESGGEDLAGTQRLPPRTVPAMAAIGPAVRAARPRTIIRPPRSGSSTPESLSQPSRRTLP
jgi:hypothetical protein